MCIIKCVLSMLCKSLFHTMSNLMIHFKECFVWLMLSSFFFLNCVLVHRSHSPHGIVRAQHKGVCSLLLPRGSWVQHCQA